MGLGGSDGGRRWGLVSFSLNALNRIGGLDLGSNCTTDVKTFVVVSPAKAEYVERVCFYVFIRKSEKGSF